jgi:large subunit ribosomal protein L27
MATSNQSLTKTEQYVIPGNIIFRQRGTHWFPGENCAMGRDHTIYATESGYVKYYKDPLKHPKRQYIGVVFERDQMLPLPRNAARKRRLGMVATKMEMLHVNAAEESHVQTHVQMGEVEEVERENGEVVALAPVGPARVKKERRGEEGRNLQLRPGYQYREGNWEIGRAAERAKVKVREYKPRDRWVAWRKTVARKAKNAERRGLNRKIKKK